jgi:hypothetical protein
MKFELIKKVTGFGRTPKRINPSKLNVGEFGLFPTTGSLIGRINSNLWYYQQSGCDHYRSVDEDEMEFFNDVEVLRRGSQIKLLV